MLFRARERWCVSARELVNALRAISTNTASWSRRASAICKRIEEMIADRSSDLPAPASRRCRNCSNCIDQIGSDGSKTDEDRSRDCARQAETARRLQTMPGVGPMTALAVEAFAPPMETFQTWPRLRRLARARPAAALVRRQGEARACFEEGQRDIRRLLIIGAMAVVHWARPQRRRPKGHGWRGCWRESHGCSWRSRWPTRWRARSGPC